MIAVSSLVTVVTFEIRIPFRLVRSCVKTLSEGDKRGHADESWKKNF